MRGFKVGAKPKAPRSIKSGTIQGPGTGTSDDVKATVAEGSYVMPADSTAQIGAEQLQGMGAPVDVNLSNGEQLMSPEQVHAVGVQTLDAMKNATHTPSAGEAARGFSPAGRGEEGKPELFFAGGGPVFGGVDPDELGRGNTPQRNVIPRPAPIYVDSQGTATRALPSQSRALVPAGPVTGTDVATTRQPSPTGAAPDAEAPKASARHEPDYRARAEAKARAARDTAAFQAERAAQDARFEAAKNQPAAPEKTPGRARSAVNGTAGKGVAALSVFPALAESAAEDSTARYAKRFGMDEPTGDGSAGDILKFAALRGLGFASDLGNNLTMGLAGNLYRDNQGEQAPGTAAAAPRQAPASAAPAQAAPAATTATQARTQPASAPAVPAAGGDLPTDTSPRANDITRVGNSFSGTSIGPGFTVNGQPFQPTGVERSPQNETAVQNLMARTPEFGQGAGAQQAMREQEARGFNAGGPRVTVIPDSSRGDDVRRRAIAAASRAMPGAQNGQLTSSQRDTLRSLAESDERNATSRYISDSSNSAQILQTGMREQGQDRRSASRDQIDSRRLAGEEESRGFQTRAAQRIEKLYEQYEKAAPEDRAAIAEQLRVLAGKDKPDQYGTVSLGTEIDPVTGMVTNRGDAVFNRSNGQIIGQSAALPPIEQNPQALAIKNNQNLSRDERAKQLRALGYQ